MCTTTILPDIGDLRDLQALAVLDTIVERRRSADQAEADLLALTVAYATLHPVTDAADAAGWVLDETPLLWEPATAPLAGVGTPEVAEQAVVELGAALGVPYRAALGLLGEAVELHCRLPRLWELVQTGRLQAWKARLVAKHTPTLSQDAVAFVDQHVSVPGRRNRIPASLKALVSEAVVRCDPEVADGLEEAALKHRDVTFDHRESTATTKMTATLDTLDATDLENRISDVANAMGRLGDTSPIGVRRAHALGMLAGRQTLLDVGTGGTAQAVDTSTTPDRLNSSVSTLYLHIDADDLADRAGPGTVERLGTATLHLLRDWLQRVDRVTIRPVLDLGRTDAVDRHDPPGWMRETVILRDRHCVFPGCGIDARACDLDHINAYVSPDDGGPPGQTSATGLACLCRRHHRAKTFDGWTYRRTSTGYEWTSPHGFTYLTSPGPQR